MSLDAKAETPKPFWQLVPQLPVVLGLLALGIPSVVSLGRQVWSSEAGAHGPIVLATGLWLLWRQRASLIENAEPGREWLAWSMLGLALPIYVFGRAYDFISIEVAGLYVACLSALLSAFGLRALVLNWFPLLYLGFIVPPPGWLVDGLTAPLKEFVSFAATELVSAFGIPVTRLGVSLIVAQYQLLVEDACSGMNSLVGLVAISLFYIYLARNASWKYSAALVSLVIPIAIFANIIRIVVLILLTYFFGDAVAQGFLHETAGLFLFATALMLVFLLDSVLSKFLRKGRRRVD